jgi:hypothetical protein
MVGMTFPLPGQPGHGRTAFVRRQPVRIVDGRAEGGYTAVFEPARVRRAAGAWKGGKPPRAFDEMPALSGAGQVLAICGRYEGAW